MSDLLPANAFIFEFEKEFKRSLNNEFFDNYDKDRFGINPENKFRLIKRIARNLLTKLRIIKNKLSKPSLNKTLNFIYQNQIRLERLYENLADPESQDILIKILTFRTLGHKKVKLPLNNKEYWGGVKKIKKMADRYKYLPSNFRNWDLPFFDLESTGYPIKLYNSPGSIFTHFILKQYQCKNDDYFIGVHEGDEVIDAGSCWGESSLLFSFLSAPNGRVLSIEFLPSNLDVQKKNLDLNSDLAKRIDIIESPVWSKSKVNLDFQDKGPGTTIISDRIMEKSGNTKTITIDDLVKEKRLPKVDFIKMDIEGAELPALKGAERTIKRYRPNLAISIYHSLDDFLDIPEYINSLNLGYRLFIRHFTIHAEETILFATVGSND